MKEFSSLPANVPLLDWLITAQLDSPQTQSRGLVQVAANIKDPTASLKGKESFGCLSTLFDNLACGSAGTDLE
jgi:hypothetical protein